MIDTGEEVYWAWNSNNHSNSLVPLYARGPGAELFADFIAGNDTVCGDYIDNTTVFTVMDAVLNNGGFVAYNDLAWATGQTGTNITTITSPNGGSGLASSGELVDYITGTGTGVTLMITGGNFNGDTHATVVSGAPSAGTDAYNVFNGKVTAFGSISYQNISPPSGDLELTFTGLYPSQTYELIFYAHRYDYSWDRYSLVTISGADAFTNESSVATDNPEAGSGGAIFSGSGDDSTRLPADNDNGYVARFTGINPGSDGTVMLTVSWDGMSGYEYKGKCANALMLKQETGSSSSPTLSILEPDGTGDTVVVGDLYNITYSLNDPDDVVTAAFYYDTDNTGLDGTAIIGSCASAAEGTEVSCAWDTSGMTPGSYYVCGVTDDGTGQVSAYSPGQITISSGGGNIAPLATVTASSENVSTGQLAVKAVDGVVDGYPGDYTKEWATLKEKSCAWIQLTWSSAYTVDRIILYDRPNTSDQILSATLSFSDGSTLQVGPLDNAGGATEYTFSTRVITSVTMTVDQVSGSTSNIGLAEIEVYNDVGGTPPTLSIIEAQVSMQ